MLINSTGNGNTDCDSPCFTIYSSLWWTPLDLFPWMNSRETNWHTMITINQSLIELLKINDGSFSILDDVQEIDRFYQSLTIPNVEKKCPDRGFSLARIDLRTRMLSFLKLNTNSNHALEIVLSG